MLLRAPASVFAASMMILATGIASAQRFPNKPIRVVTTAPGGSQDFAIRLIAPGLTDGLGQSVVVDNRGGAGGIIARETVAGALPDGYTLLIDNNGMWTLPLMTKVPYDAVADFSPISLLAMAPAILVVSPSLPIRSVRELIDFAKARPGELNYGGGGAGSQNFLAAELFKSMAGGLKIENVPFKGGGPALIALLGGEVQIMFASAASVTPHIKSGKVRALAITSAQPSPLFPGLPTIAESGVPGYEVVSNYGIFAPAKTPAAIINRLNHEIGKVLARDEVKQKFAAVGMDVVSGSPGQLAAKMQGEITGMAGLFKNADIRAN